MIRALDAAARRSRCSTFRSATSTTSSAARALELRLQRRHFAERLQRARADDAESRDGLSQAAIAGSQAEQLYNMARSRQLQTRITMLGVGYPEDRYATLQNALQLRVKNDGLDFETMQHDDLSPGEVAAASIVAADTNSTPEAIVDESKTTDRRIVDVANARGMRSEALEIFLGLVYLDYTDDPVKESHATAH
jgi:hypothetical protein